MNSEVSGNKESCSQFMSVKTSFFSVPEKTNERQIIHYLYQTVFSGLAVKDMYHLTKPNYTRDMHYSFRFT
jgi:hypothetical protein